MGQYLCKPKYWHGDLLGAVQYNPYSGCGSTYVWDDWDPAAFRFKDAEWKKGTALRIELEDFLARWRKRKEWWNKFPSIALIVLYAAGAAPTQISLRLNWSKNSTKFVRKTKTRSSSIWVFTVGQSISELTAAVSMGGCNLR